MKPEEAIPRVKKYMECKTRRFCRCQFSITAQKRIRYDTTKALQHCYHFGRKLRRRICGKFGGLPLTPEFDKLTQRRNAIYQYVLHRY